MSIKPFVLISFLISLNLSADYLRLGKVEANFCEGFLIEYCRFETVDGIVDGEDYFELPKVFKRPSQVTGDKCWLSHGLPSFFIRDDESKYINLGKPDYITFKCKKL